jgi:hypothetical protein
MMKMQRVPLRAEKPARAEDAGGDPVVVSALGPPDEGVLGDIAHEMGNHLHKLYYWTNYLREQVGDRGEAEAAAVEMLGTSVERLERFMRMLLEYFAPARMCFSKVSVGELIGGLGAYLPGRRLVVDGLADCGEVAVSVDAGLIAHAIRTVFERVASTLVDETEMHVRLVVTTLRQYRGVEIAFEVGATAGHASLGSGIEMSVAEKFLQMHGAEVFERKGPPRALVVFLPLYT